MKCISIQQPWAWLVVHGKKPVENRTWESKYRGPLLIHTGKKFDYDGFKWVRENFPKAFIEDGCFFDSGCIIGKVEMTDCVTAHESPWFFGPYGFVFRNPQIIRQIPYKGKLGIFDVPDDILKQVI